jgi:hypothetical protein
MIHGNSVLDVLIPSSMSEHSFHNVLRAPCADGERDLMIEYEPKEFICSLNQLQLVARSTSGHCVDHEFALDRFVLLGVKKATGDAGRNVPSADFAEEEKAQMQALDHFGLRSEEAAPFGEHAAVGWVIVLHFWMIGDERGCGIFR